MEELKLSDIFQLEQSEKWKEAAYQYAYLYAEMPTNQIAMHYAFFCWYLLWQWDEICFPGEEITPLYERINADTRNGISKSCLLSRLDLTTKQLLTINDTPVEYLVMLTLMEKIYPYFFKKETFSEADRCQLIENIGKTSLENLGTKVIYQYVQTQASPTLIEKEKTAVSILFPQNSLIHTYLIWLFN